MNIRRANEEDIPRLDDLLYQVHRVHSTGRPDIFRVGNKKYTDDGLRVILASDETPVFVAENVDGLVVGYAFCVVQQVKGEKSLMDRKTLYIDDLCVDENQRRKGIGEALYRFVLEESRRLACDAVTLNVWYGNDALKFYEKCGMKPQKIGMEYILC